MNSQERNGSIGSILGDLIRSPQKIAALTQELRRLNKNLEALQELQPLEELTEVLADLRTMLAPILGWKVVDQEKKNKPTE